MHEFATQTRSTKTINFGMLNQRCVVVVNATNTLKKRPENLIKYVEISIDKTET